MLYVATVHFRSEQWIDVQLSYLRRNLHEPFAVFAVLQDVPGDHAGKFARVVPAGGPHAGKLNLLAAEIAAVAEGDDLVVFLDGDAFPVEDPMPVVREALERTVLVAVRRDENANDVQPHPSFCAIRVRDWQALHGDWSAGHSWLGADGRPMTDVGGNLLRALELAGAPWTPLLRSNRVDPHPLWYGVYGGVVYHHGAGFRSAVGRVDLLARTRPGRLGRTAPGAGALLRRWDESRRRRAQSEAAAAAERLHEEMFAKLRDDPEFYRALL
jgi:hypothetical protein